MMMKINNKILSEGKIVVKTIKIKQLSGRFSVLAAVFAVTAMGGVAFAATNTPNFTQQINPGVLAGKILNASGVEVTAPAVALSAKNFSFACQSSTGTLSTASERLYVENATAGTANGWTMAINAATPGTDTFTSGANTMAYNGTGCTDGSYAGTGQLSLSTDDSTVITDSGTAGTATIGGGGSFTGESAITLMQGTAANAMWRGHITDIAVTQKIPPAQPAGTYAMNFVVTTVAN